MAFSERHEQRFVPATGSVAEVRTFVRAALSEATFDAEVVVLMANELATNAVVHARTPFTVEVIAEPFAARVEVADAAPHLPVVTRQADLLDAGGRGMSIVNRLASSWGVNVESTTKQVWFEYGRPSWMGNR